jgi:4-carboxymuconolactone decarboxylase
MPIAPRIAPVEPPYTEALAETLRKWMPPGAAVEPLALFRTLAIHPLLSERMRPLGAALLGRGLLPPRVRELVILRTSARLSAEYEWGVHAAAYGAALGFDAARLAATAAGAPDDPAFTDEERPLVRFVDELRAEGRVSAATWEALAARFEPPALLELLALCGFYHLIAFVCNGAGVALEPWAARFPVSEAGA